MGESGAVCIEEYAGFDGNLGKTVEVDVQKCRGIICDSDLHPSKGAAVCVVIVPDGRVVDALELFWRKGGDRVQGTSVNPVVGAGDGLGCTCAVVGDGDFEGGVVGEGAVKEEAVVGCVVGPVRQGSCGNGVDGV